MYLCSLGMLLLLLLGMYLAPDRYNRGDVTDARGYSSYKQRQLSGSGFTPHLLSPFIYHTCIPPAAVSLMLRSTNTPEYFKNDAILRTLIF